MSGSNAACDLSGEERPTPWEHGPVIAQALKDVQMEGLSGNIRFNSIGHRTNFSLDVVEMSPESKMITIGSWTDDHGLRITKNPLIHRGYVPQAGNVQ